MENLKKFEKDEYEIELYGFAIDDFLHENFKFIEQQITKSMDYMNNIFFDMVKEVKDIKPEIKDTITSTTKSITKNIQEKCKENIEKNLNAEIKEALTIPENTLLHFDRVQSLPSNQDNLNLLENECEELFKTMKDNALFINLLEDEWNSYAIQEFMDEEATVINKAEKYLDLSFDTEILLNNSRKINFLTEK